LKAQSKGPLLLAPVTTYNAVQGSRTTGSLADISASDDNRLILSPVERSAKFGLGIVVSTTAPSATPASFNFGLESSNPSPTGRIRTQSIEMWNWATSAWELVDTRPTTVTDSLAVVTISANPARFVNSSTLEVKARISYSFFDDRTGLSSNAQLDQVGFQFN